ncbi:MAG: hypothetical protein ACOX2I_13075 [Candidatus Ozemobacteraceae bacterium]
MVNDKNNIEREFSLIKEGLKLNKGRIAEFLKQRVGPGDWSLSEEEFSEPSDLLFATEDNKKRQYVLIDISVPHLGIGQKYLLPAKGKVFQKEKNVPASRIKKAIILIRRGIDGVKTLPARIRCPIIEVQLENIVARKTSNKEQDTENKNVHRSDHRNDRNATAKKTVSDAGNEPAPKAPEVVPVTSEMLSALKEAMVYDCISTAYKRTNKYVCRGLWKWIEREIIDSNVHFFFIILSAIYQGKTGEILGRKFNTFESMTEHSDDVINAIFSKENPLVDDIKKDSERHKKAISKFMICFAQTPPFEYLKSLFLKEFRSSGDSLKARMSVYTTLQQLLERCGFEGEREVFYPLEILDELKIYQGIMVGDYSKLRIDNASKKLKHLIPQVNWTADDIYKLRDDLAKALSVPSAEFNLNAYLPQAFYQDAKLMAATKKEAIRKPEEKQQQSKNQDFPDNRQEDRKREPRDRHFRDRQKVEEPKSEIVEENKTYKVLATEEEYAKQPSVRNSDVPPKKHRRNYEEESAYKAAMQAEKADGSMIPASESKKPVKRVVAEEVHGNDQPIEDAGETPIETPKVGQYVEYDLFGNAINARTGDCDEARHRFFESYGGQFFEDMDALKMAIAMTNYEKERLARAARAPKVEVEKTEAEYEAEDNYMPPTKNQMAKVQPRRPYNPSDNMQPRRPQSNDNRDSRNSAPNRDSNRKPYNRDKNNSSKRYNNKKGGFSRGKSNPRQVSN